MTKLLKESTEMTDDYIIHIYTLYTNKVLTFLCTER